ncbi:MAG: hypothetical protein FJX80_01180 [Bacteroidetes bacterium]|nr:hypothetical protein [Bacteroidota bacterium]
MSDKEQKKDSDWVQHVKKYAEEHGISYAKALTASKPSYVKPDVVPKLVSVPRKPKTQKQNKQPHPDKKTRKSPKKAEVSVPPVPSAPVVEPNMEPVILVESYEPELLAIARTIKNKVCKEKIETTQHNLREAQNAHTKQITECEEILYGELVKNYFKDLETTKLTHIDLLKGLQRFYKDNKKSDMNYTLTFDGFIRLFSQKTAVQGANYKRQHIFEALCRLLLLFNYDRNMFGTHKKFYTSLEEFNKMPKDVSSEEILETPVNVSSKAGIVDIFFRTENNAKSISAAEEPREEEEESNNTDDWACECINTISKPKSSSKKYNYIMIQNKYYEVEKSSISHYDVTRIYTLASKYQEHDKIFDDGEAKIVLMVNNEDAVSSNLMRAKQQYNGLLSDGDQGIIGVKRLNEWFEKLLFDLLGTRDIPDFKSHIGLKAAATKPLLQPRFHQKFIIDCTEKYIQKGIPDQDGNMKPVSKFIWGAVPRSGKSFMIGGLISNRFKRPENQKNDIVIILGAKTETESQFIKMFKAFEDFSGYNIYVGGMTKQDAQVAGKPTIYLFSQEYLKDKCDWSADVSTATFKEKEGKGLDLKTRFEGRNIDLYFDEIHKGGSTDNSQSVIYTFKNNKVGINIFVMVTATFAKPSAKYEGLNFIGSANSTTKIIEWSYNDQQHMKNISDATKLEIFINTRKDEDIQKAVLEKTFDHYHQYYGASYLTVLTGEYAKYPELVLLSPQSIELDVIAPAPAIKLTDLSTNDIRNCFTGNLHCAACTVGEPVLFYKDYRHIFHNVQPVNNVLDFISGSIRNYMKNVVKYPMDSPHTELWFLPDKHLYPTDADCKSKGCAPVVTDETLEADDSVKDVKTGIANIEPLTRGLAYMITEDRPRFNDYNVFIVHNTPFNYLSKGEKENGKGDGKEKGKKDNEITSEKLFGDITYEDVSDKKIRRKRIGVYDSKKGGLSDQIKAFERESYKHGKSVIILTGAKLRLGISLPCADIAFNFDDIKSIDANYQTMFRVLTEREKPDVKKYGYYFDFNKERSIQFLYEYNKTYGESKKKSSITENLQELQSLLFTFNYNGLNIIKKHTATEVGLYNKLITELRLNEEGYRAFWSKKENIVSMLKRVLSVSDNQDIVKELYKVLKMSKTVVSSKDKEFVVLKEGEKRPEMPKMVVHNADESESDAGAAAIDDDDDDSDDEPDKEDYGEIVNQIAESLPTIIALLAMFSVDSGCNTVEECLRHSVEKIMDGASRCTCENIDESIDSVNILDCFFNSGKLTESEIQKDDAHEVEYADADDVDATENEEPQDGGAGKPKKISKIQKQTKRIKQINDEIKQGKKTKADLDAAKAKLSEMKKNENRQYTQRELKHVMEILLQIVSTKKDEEFTSTINNIFDTIREAVETMPTSKDMKSEGKHGLIYGMDVSGIEQKITSYLSVREEEKDKFGEVFTPMSLINEMFDKLPKEVWSDPDKKWLDPANGIGNFPMVAYMRLMEGLKTHPKYSNDQTRSRHILENMLFMVEINPKNVKISRRIFGSNANICCADFLNETDKVLKLFKVDKFDVVMGNPPFQKEVVGGLRNGAYGGRTLWDQFTTKSLDLLKDGGLLGFITPPPWRKPEHELFDVMTKDNQLLYLHIFGEKQVQDIFHVSARVDLYIIEKTRKYKDTEIVDELNKKDENGNNVSIKLDVSKWNFIPNYAYKSIQKIITSEQNGLDVIYSRGNYGTDKPHVKDKPDAKYKYPVVHSINQDGLVFWYTDDNTKGHFGVSKVLLNFNRHQYPVNDYEGKYGMSQITYGIPIKSKKEGDDIVRAINSDEFKEIIKATKWGAFQTDWRMFKYFRPDFYKFFLDKTTASTKIQSLVRGHQQRQKTRKIKETKTNSGSAKTKKGGGSHRTRRRVTNKKQQTTRKNKFFNWL